MDKTYTSKEVAEILGVSDKSVRRYLNSYFSLENGAYQISKKMLSVLKSEHLGQLTDNPVQEFRTEYFTEEEYAEFQKRLTEYPLLKENIEFLSNHIEYYRKSMISKDRQLEMILLAITDKRFLEE